MIEAYSVSSVRAAETAAMGELPPGTLMDRAARGLADVVAVRLRERAGRRVVALVGGGDNGGDALFAVAALAEEGVAAAVVTLSEHPHAAGLAAVTEAGVEVVASLGSEAAPRAVELVEEADVVLDGILGIGGRPGLPPAAEAVVRAVPDESMVIAVDLPSGADPAGETSAPSMVFADETVTFGVAKPVHLLPATEPAVGVLTVVDIGVTVAGPAQVQRLTHDDAAALWPVPGPADDKYSRGVLGIVAGGEGYTGAPLLSVTAAVAAGAGMVRYVGPPTPTLLVRSTVPEAVHGAGRVQAWLVGPGLDAAEDTEHGRTQRRAALDALASGEPCVVDAGGLDLLERGPRPAPTLLTPHAGELARLLTRLDQPVERADVTAAPVRHARRLAELTGATVLLKGATTLVVDPGAAGMVRSQADAPPWLATAGSGDVLAGLAGMLLASGLSPLDAGSVAALVHGLAGDAANPGGPVRALGVAHAIPVVVAGLLARGAHRS